MPVQGPPWTEFLSCHICYSMFDELLHRPISLGCGHTICKNCLPKLQNGKCPFDQSMITRNVDDLPVNYALLQLVGAAIPIGVRESEENIATENPQCYEKCNKCIEDLAVYLKTDSTDLKSEVAIDDDDCGKGGHMGNLLNNNMLSRPMQRKLVSLVNCQLIEEEGRSRAMRAARSLGERAVTELILQHQNPHQLSANLWAAVRARGCQFLGPAMQEEVLKLILLVLEDASSLSRKVLVLFVVQQLEDSYPQASKTAIGHVVQLLYRASCFKVTKREEESSLMQLKEEFRTYEALRREHDSQIVQIAMEAGLRISPEQWSSLLYGDTSHKSHMQSIIDKLQTPQSFSQSINELAIALQRTGDPCSLHHLRPHLEFLANVDPSPDAPHPTWENLKAVLKALCTVVEGLVQFFTSFSQKKNELLPLQNARYKTSMCRDQTQQGMCPRGNSCTFAHSQEELEKYRARSKKLGAKGAGLMPTFAALTPKEKAELDKVNKLTSQKLASYSKLAETTGTTKVTGEKPEKKIKETTLAESLGALSLSSRPQPPADRIPSSPGANSGIPQGNTTPSVAAPAHYRKPSLGTGPAVKETYFHPRMPQGTTRMTPYEMSAVEGNRFNSPPYQVGHQVHQRTAPPVGQYHAMHYSQQDPGMPTPPYGNSYVVCDHKPPPSVSDQWSPNSHYCGAPDAMYGSRTPLGPPQNYPKYEHQRYCPGPVTPGAAPPFPAQSPAACNANQIQQCLNDLHSRRNKIIAHLQHQGGPPLIARGMKPQAWQQLANSHMNNSKRSALVDEQTRNPCTALVKSVADTYVAARTMFSLATSGLLNEPQSVPSSYSPSSYVKWSSDDSCDIDDKSEVRSESQTAWSTDELCTSSRDVAVDDNDDDYVKSLFSWFEEDMAQEDSSNGHVSKNQLVGSYNDQTFIPFDPPLVSRFGPISRMARARLNNTDPVQVTADETIKRMTPVTAVAAMDCPLPAAAPVPSRFSFREIPPPIPVPRNSSAIPTERDVLSAMWPNRAESQFMIQSDPTRFSRKQLQQEVVRLESQAQDACCEDESLAYELQAIELRISLQSGKKANRPCTERRGHNGFNRGHFQPASALGDFGYPAGSVRASDPALTADEQKKLHELAVTFGSADQKCSEQQERILSQLLKLQDLGSQSSYIHQDHV